SLGTARTRESDRRRARALDRVARAARLVLRRVSLALADSAPFEGARSRCGRAGARAARITRERRTAAGCDRTSRCDVQPHGCAASAFARGARGAVADGV